MKKILLTIAAALTMVSSACAQRLSDISVEARFITDKMVAELGLSDLQRRGALQLNISYLSGIAGYRDIEADGWKHRNKKLKRLLSAEQWRRYKNSYYFYRPIGWRDGAYVHNIYAKYPKKPVFRGSRFDTPPPPPRDGKFDKKHRAKKEPRFKENRRFDRGPVMDRRPEMDRKGRR